MGKRSPLPLRGIDEDAALRKILEGTATETGEPFFAALVKNLAQSLNTHGAWVTEYLEERRRLRSLAFWMEGESVLDYEYDIAGTPCEPVIDQGCLIHFSENVVELFPADSDLKRFHAVSYMGVPLRDIGGRILGHLAVLDRRPMPEEPRGLALFRIFAARAAAELQRLRAEEEVREREERLTRLVDSAMDAILELDRSLRVTLVNQAAEKVFRCGADRLFRQDFAGFLTPGGREKLSRLMEKLDARPKGQQYLWIPGGLLAIRPGGGEFPAEATLSRSEMGRQVFFTLILRDVNERLEAERKIRSLTNEAEYLREEIRSLHNENEMIGESEPFLRILRDVEQVAKTDATVLILGETGTGKEVVARAIHSASRRSARSLIKVNCAAIPAALMESEFFGHEKGAFTGATREREGRFALAHGGTIFLDEVGELPLELQSKLLRVLQEGEFEPVGGSKTRKVNVRVIAATNRDLHRSVKEGKFREDLYYRLNVFPLSIPPLRERCRDIPLLATAFARKHARSMGRPVEPLSRDCIRRLEEYRWPGNVRELENVVERALITSPDGCLNLDRALPDPSCPAAAEAVPSEAGNGRIRTAREMEEMDRQNVIRALESAGWRVSGQNGAARLLGMKPSTLTSRLKALGIQRPR